MRRRRGRGEGGVYQRGDGLWVGSLTIGYDGSGRRRRRVVYGATKAEVVERLVRLQHEVAVGLVSDPERITVVRFLERWLEDSVRRAVRSTTHTLYRQMCRIHIIPRIGGLQLPKLRPLHVEQMLTGMEKDGKKPRLCQLAYTILHRALNDAVRGGLIPRNVCEAVARPRAPRKTMQTLLPEQAAQLLEASEADRLHALYVLAVTMGLRQGELLGLQWPDVDLDAARLSVRHQLCEMSGQLWLDEPKTAKARRQVELPAIAVVALREHRSRMQAEGHWQADGYVFTDTEGGLIRKSNLRRRSFEPLLELRALRERLRKQGVAEDALPKPLPRIRFHDLRHTAATLALKEGVHPKVVQEMLGHSQIAVTLDTYSHVLPTMQKEAAAKIDALFAGLTR